MATGDLTGDRHPDLLVRDHAGYLWLYTGTGSVSKPFNTRVKVGSGWGMCDQLVGDVDGDGLGDVLTRTLSGELWFHKGAGSATAPLKARVKVGTGWNTYNVISGPDDLDGDGDGMSDLIGRSRDGKQYFYKSIGGGKFAAPTYYGSGWERNKFMVGAGTTQLYGKAQNLATEANNTLAKYSALANGYYLMPPVAAGTETPRSRNTYATTLNNHNHASYVRNIGSDLYIRGRRVSTTRNYTMMVGPGDLTGDGKDDLLSRELRRHSVAPPRRRCAVHQARRAHQGQHRLERLRRARRRGRLLRRRAGRPARPGHLRQPVPLQGHGHGHRAQPAGRARVHHRHPDPGMSGQPKSCRSGSRRPSMAAPPRPGGRDGRQGIPGDTVARSGAVSGGLPGPRRRPSAVRPLPPSLHQ
ncbi:FG-GAP-like repeat-containing protein [Streptomyces sp. NPDC048269]|uniref:FG-GAP-like repeat-containing protein n=1 Tax=Streptomyces sp. NPDC048269 TaxID=3155753 RepID=UPI003415FDBE